MYAIILCGGSGTRLWPLSRKNYPKQFLNLYSDFSLLQETFLRACKIMPPQNIFLVTNKDNYFNVLNQVRVVFPKIKEKQIITEPASINTAPAIVLAVKYLTEKIKIKKDVPIINFHSDHYISNQSAFVKTIKSALKQIGTSIGTIGIKPTAPEIAYGYIKKGKKCGGYFMVNKFKEKPDFETAQKYFASKKYLWNSGIYLFTAETLAKELEKHAPGIYHYFIGKYSDFLTNFTKLPSIAIDTAISEKTKNMIVFESDFGWSDVGSFDGLASISPQTNKEQSRHIFIDSKNIFAHSSAGRLIATLGVSDLAIIENNDCILIHKRGRGDDVKKIVQHLKENRYKELDHNIISHRPWGKYEILVDDKNHKVKKITVFPKASLSLQSHKRRAEHWIVVKGTAKIIKGNKEMELRENESIYIPAGVKHRLSNRQKTNLDIIEVQTGDYFEEDDITRYDDVYKRQTLA